MPRRDKRVDSEQTERWRAIEQANVPSSRRRFIEGLDEPVSAIAQPDHLHFRARQVDRRGQKFEPRDTGRHGRFGDTGIADFPTFLSVARGCREMWEKS